MANNLKPYYAAGVRVGHRNATEREFFYNDKFIGRVDTVKNWGTSYRAIPVKGECQLFRTLRDASDYLVTCFTQTSK